MDDCTESVRKLAPCWSLAGDEQLLNILESTHQKLLSKCQEANSQLQQMATALNDASISLQNVNNQFMALSSSQFIESRVYDDDDVTAEEPAVKEQPKPEISDELTSLKHSISVLENAHEIITILQDSDTESDSDDEITDRLVLKPKDMYADRPLPYIIGSQPWKNKWHAGLVLEDSDTDSIQSKADLSDQYSQSEPEDNTDKLRVIDTHDNTVSDTSSELPSDQGSVPKQAQTQSDVASEIARKLGAQAPTKMVEREHEYEEPAKPTVRKVYRPQDPVSSTIFPDEPPPLSDHSDSDSDIFADLHNSQPFARTRNIPTSDLFSENYENNSEADIFGDFVNKPVTDPSAKPASLFDAGPAPHMFDKHHTRNDNYHNTVDQKRNNNDQAENKRMKSDNYHQTGDGRSNYHNNSEIRSYVHDNYQASNDQTEHKIDDSDGNVKKPIGGISLFGNKGTESIGAAILKRNQRKSSTSGDESGSDPHPEAQEPQIRKEKDIFDDLFARSEDRKVTKEKDFVKDIKTEIQKKTEVKVIGKKVEKPKVDLFSDNLFDDIDDIFTTNVVKMPAKDNSKAKSIFEDDDDLFSEIAAPKPMKIEVASSSSNKKSLFDSDDELFSENVPTRNLDEKPKSIEKATEVNKPVKIAETPKINESKINKSIFDDGEDDIFSHLKTKTNKEVQNSALINEKYNDFSKGNEQTSKTLNQPQITSAFKSPSLFESDEDDSDLFAESRKSSNITAPQNKNIEETSNKKHTVITERTPEIEKLDKNVDTIPPCSVKIEDLGLKNDNLDKNSSSKTNESCVNNVDNICEPTKSFGEDSTTSALPVIENVDRNEENTNIQISAAKIFDHIHKTIQNIESSSDTNNDFSDQDFDDLPPKIEESNKKSSINTNVKDTEVKSDKEPKEKHNIFDKNTLEDNIFTKSETPQKSETITKNIEPVITETIPETHKKTEQDYLIKEISTKSIDTDIFSDIVTEPPVFQKPKEPKKSKNVNALFDDDSDDESLFFKKNDPIFEENSEEFTLNQDRFGVFTDEPPDVRFDDLDDMFCTPKIPQNENLPPIPDVDNFEDITLPGSESKMPEIDKIDHVENIFGTLPKNEVKPVIEIPKIPIIGAETEDIFKSSDTKNVDNSKATLEQQLSPTFSEDEQIFKISQTEKPTLQDKQSDLFSDDENLFSSLPKEKPSLTRKELPVPEIKNIESPSKISDDELFSSLSKTEKPIPKKEIVKQDSHSKSDEELFKKPMSKPELVPNSENSSAELTTESKSEPKKVGKLKVGLNINVNALLPGASPKKVKPNDQTDGQSQSVSDNKNLETDSQKSEFKVPENQTPDSKLLKSVSFDGKPDSDILDNKLSKERARIQVKRRPSTRKARREAVRKSGIDFGEDSTDNSSSIDDPPRTSTEKQPDVDKMANIEDDNSKRVNQSEKIQVESIDKLEIKAKSEDIAIHEPEIQTRIEDKKAEIQPKNVEKHGKATEKLSHSKDVKSKIVYILNDEDIFNTSPIEKSESMNKGQTSLISENLDSNTGVSTLGKVYDKTNTKNETKIDSNTSLFGEEVDGDFFKAKPVAKKASIFDSDSEEDLFGTSKKVTAKRVEVKKEAEKREEVKKDIKREVVKGSLFSDVEDDDNLFGVKTKKSVVEQKPQPSRATAKEAPKAAEPVFADPLSMFSDDD